MSIFENLLSASRCLFVSRCVPAPSGGVSASDTVDDEVFVCGAGETPCPQVLQTLCAAWATTAASFNEMRDAVPATVRSIRRKTDPGRLAEMLVRAIAPGFMAADWGLRLPFDHFPELQAFVGPLAIHSVATEFASVTNRHIDDLRRVLHSLRDALLTDEHVTAKPSHHTPPRD